MEDLVLIVIEGFSAVLAFILVRFMIKPFRVTGEGRYLGLPFGFGLLGVSYVFMGVALCLSNPLIIERTKWLQLFTGAYAFVFLAVTYYFSRIKTSRKVRPLTQAIIALLILMLVFLFITFFLPPVFVLPSYKAADEYFRLFNMILAIYITIETLVGHVQEPNPKTVLAPLGYALLAFSQYSFLVWSLDSSFSAFAGAHIIRVASLLVFLFVSYRAIIAPHKPQYGKSGAK